MARVDPHVRLRIPADTKASVQAAAEVNKRTMNAEIVARLEASGKTLRDEFAMAALTGLMADTATADPKSLITPSMWATLAYQMADAMLAERSK